eukprot:GHVL01015032.1.p1 GENE.GHVL01015032.1~~GHVL01015032.1.p1  ORF type:complete len:632 (-),score=149.15 GHVL01015032.1:154-2049(-)
MIKYIFLIFNIIFLTKSARRWILRGPNSSAVQRRCDESSKGQFLKYIRVCILEQDEAFDAVEDEDGNVIEEDISVNIPPDMKPSGVFKEIKDLLEHRKKLRSYEGGSFRGQPDDEFYDFQEHHETLKMTKAWSVTTGAEDLVIAIFDTGVDYLHEDLHMNIWNNPDEIPDDGIDNDGNGFIDDVHGWDFYNSDNDPMDDSDLSHGTHVAGIVGSMGNNKIGTAGMLWNVKLIPIKFAGSDGRGMQSSVLMGLNYLEMLRQTKVINLRIVNHSWGSSKTTNAVRDVIMTSEMLHICAAGNSGLVIDGVTNNYFPAQLAFQNTIAVAASNVDDNNCPAEFSNIGPSIDIAAPGVLVWSTVSSDLKIFGGVEEAGPDTKPYFAISGTSMATPMVTGVAGLLMSVYPSLTAWQTKFFITESANTSSCWNKKTATGKILDARAAMKLLSIRVPPEDIEGFDLSSLDNETDGRLFQNRETDGRPFQNRETDAPFQNNETDARPFQNNGNEGRPFQNNETDARPLQNRQNNDRPFQNNETDGGLFQNRENYDRTLENNETAGRPFQNDETDAQPFKRDVTDRVGKNKNEGTASSKSSCNLLDGSCEEFQLQSAKTDIDEGYKKSVYLYLLITILSLIL